MLILFFSYMTTAVFNNKTSPVDNYFRSQCSALQHPLIRVDVRYIGKCSGMQRLRHEDGTEEETGLSQQHSEVSLYKKGCTMAINVHCDLIWTSMQQHLAMYFT